ncbi:carbohydrate ABC transporter permease [Actinopolymorpha singaporensis]|uniref:Carbohydrate ABC transporter membrane protein 2, CUT1 family n=1 Tax=Actinopolymorpha singaporensis TaxID=117157 RepID=A0A1H1RUC5_9ACTN|nr:carbohydrate ABC transporter permease [Actinopolymorpha singaporensis]SDS39265.1 carbohydrate ABC transporter membrane protein 2, CUT1 family [Actinopolymorpha singaporensis]
MSARSSRRRRRQQAVIKAVLGLIVFVGLFPFLFMLVTSFKTNQQYYESWWLPTLPLHLENYTRAWIQIRPYFVTSVVVAAAAIAGALVLCTVAAFVFARYRFFGRSVLFGLVAALLMVPGIASLIPMFVLMRDLGLLNTRVVLVIPHLVGGAVLGTLLMKTFVEQLPQELFDAARVDGAGGLRLFASIMLPLSLPVVGTIALVTVIGVWNDFFWPLLTVTENELRTVSAGLQFFQTQNATEYGPLFAGYAIASVPLLVLFVFLSKYFLAGLQGGVPGMGGNK